jgi:hypothetical protein
MAVAFQPADSSLRAVMRSRCTCECWDQRLKGTYNARGYHSFVFNMERNMAVIAMLALATGSALVSLLKRALHVVLAAGRPRLLTEAMVVAVAVLMVVMPGLRAAGAVFSAANGRAYGGGGVDSAVAVLVACFVAAHFLLCHVDADTQDDNGTGGGSKEDDDVESGGRAVPVPTLLPASPLRVSFVAGCVATCASLFLGIRWNSAGPTRFTASLFSLLHVAVTAWLLRSELAVRRSRVKLAKICLACIVILIILDLLSPVGFVLGVALAR